MKMLNLRTMKKMKTMMLIAVAVVVSFTTSYGQTGSQILVKVENVKSAEGLLLIGLFDSEENFLNQPYKSMKVSAVKGTVNVQFDDVAEGTYTVSIIHDINNNGSLDKNFMGIPNEPYGISKDGKSMFGPPSYDDAKFELANQSLALTISL